jgi:beta-aspartyl-peptidase (threonine type)
VTRVTPVIVIHAGAGNPGPDRVIDEEAHHAALRNALQAGHELLAAGAGALDAAEAAVHVLEDC